jgi:PBSX family phage terminase large subunit
LELKVTNTYKKNENAILAGLRYIVNSGGSRSSKTFSICQLLIIRVLTKKNWKISCFRNLRIDCIGTVGEDLKTIINLYPFLQSKLSYNIKDGIWTCKDTNSTIHLQGTEKLSKALGAKNNDIFFNEISEFSKEVFDQLDQRCTDIVFIDYNPSKEFYIESYRNNPMAIFIHSTFKDNPFLSDGQILKLEGYNPWEEGTFEVIDREVYYLGKKITDQHFPPPNVFNVENQTADKFNYMVYNLGLGSERPNRIYKGWTSCEDEYYHSLPYKEYFGFDFGSASPSAMVAVKWDGDRTFYLNQRLYKPSSTFGSSTAEYLQVSMKPPITSKDFIVADSAKMSMVEDLQLGGLFAVGANKGAGCKERMRKQVQAFKIVYTESSNDLNGEYFDYCFRLDRYDKPTDEVEDKNYDHLMNATEYVIDYLIPYLGIVYEKTK